MNYDVQIVLVTAVLGLITWLVLCQREHIKRQRRRHANHRQGH